MKIIIQKLSEEEIEERKIKKWPIWTKEISKFDWHYDSQEMCLILEGKITVKTAEETVDITPGDFVTFPKGLSCTWEVKEPVRKHYNFE